MSFMKRGSWTEVGELERKSRVSTKDLIIHQRALPGHCREAEPAGACVSVALLLVEQPPGRRLVRVPCAEVGTAPVLAWEPEEQRAALFREQSCHC